MTFDNSTDIIDSRDVIARLAELADPDEPEDYDEERTVLAALAEEGEANIADWQYGEALIRDSYFEQYAQELANDIGAIDRNAVWPVSFIDWTAAAEALKQDYCEIDFDGVTYWAR